jgi:hypothetical protein
MTNEVLGGIGGIGTIVGCPIIMVEGEVPLGLMFTHGSIGGTMGPDTYDVVT